MTYILNNCMHNGMHVRLLGLRPRRLEFGNASDRETPLAADFVEIRGNRWRGVCEHDVPFFGLYIPFEANLLEEHFDEEALAAEDHALLSHLGIDAVRRFVEERSQGRRIANFYLEAENGSDRARLGDHLVELSDVLDAHFVDASLGDKPAWNARQPSDMRQ